MTGGLSAIASMLTEKNKLEHERVLIKLQLREKELALREKEMAMKERQSAFMQQQALGREGPQIVGAQNVVHTVDDGVKKMFQQLSMR